MMPDLNRVISARQPFLNSDGTVSSPWFRFLEALASQVGGIETSESSISNETNSDTSGLATQQSVDDAMLLAELSDSVRGEKGESGPMVPYYIAPTEIFVVPLYQQALFTVNIDNEGTLDIEGYLVEVD